MEGFSTLLYTTALRLEEACNLTWTDIDFDLGIFHVSAKREKGSVPWEPKDHEHRQIPWCPEMINLLTQWQDRAPEQVPYVFMSAQRYAHLKQRLDQGQWREGKSLINNVPRDYKAIRKKAGTLSYTLHDFRRSCITNWARALPAHVVRKLAGHSSLEITLKYYLSVQEGDSEKARAIGSTLLMAARDSKNPSGNPTDPKLTHFGKNQVETESNESGEKEQVPEKQ